MMERRKNEKGRWRNGKCVRWRGTRSGMERRKLWIGVWMRENEREGRIHGWCGRKSGGKTKLQIFLNFKL